MPYAMKTIRLVIAIWLNSAIQFPKHPDDQVLADLLCHAASDRIEDDLAGIKRSHSEVLEGVIGRVQPPLPENIASTYRSVASADFESMLDAFRHAAANEGVDLSELAAGLRSARVIAKHFITADEQ